MNRLLTLIVVAAMFCAGAAYAYDFQALDAAKKAQMEGRQLTQEQMELLKNEVIAPDVNELDRVGGPDAFGYVFIDSDEETGPVYNWIDITETGEEVAVAYGLGDDDRIGPFSYTNFAFPLYGVDRTEFWIESNGTIYFQDYYVSLSNQHIPTTSYDALIAWNWDDMDPTEGCLLYTSDAADE